MALTDKQQRFVQEYLKDLNATEAYKRAGYKAKGARANASRLIANDNIQAAIQAAQVKLAARLNLTHDYVLRGLEREANLFGEGSSPSARCKALELIGKHLGMFIDRHEHQIAAKLHIIREIINVKREVLHVSNGQLGNRHSDAPGPG